MVSSESNPTPRVAIIGAGAGGIGMGIQLKLAGLDDFVILERAEAVGGTWYYNQYPGCACDIPSHLYSYSFEQKRDWSRPYAPQSEIREYLETCVDKYEIGSHIRLSTTVEQVAWSDDDSEWTLTLSTGEAITAEVVVSAIGMFNELAWPDISGREQFRGTSFHTARWNWDHDLRGEKVAVIGSAASAVQIVPEIVKEAGQVHLFQRTANWVMPKEDVPFTPEILAYLENEEDAVPNIREEIFTRVDAGITFSDPDAVAELEASCLASMQAVEDEALREKLRPDHPFGCKRPLLSNDYYPAFNRANLELVTDPIARITETGVVTTDGRERSVDTLIFATGFQATKYLSALNVRGRNGMPIDEAWKDGAEAYLGMTTSGFPNLFMLYGPNTNNGSLITMIEAQILYIVRQIQRLRDDALAWIDVKPDRMSAYNDEVQEAISNVKAWQAGCNGYYRTPKGRIVTQWPFTMQTFIDRTRAPDTEMFDSAPRSEGVHRARGKSAG